MLRALKLEGVGPAKKMEVRFGERLNIITGDNGLGKSFLLDIAWWALTRTWPRANAQALPRPEARKATIYAETLGKGNKKIERTAPFAFPKHKWIQPQGKPPIPGLVIYAQVDGGFSVWDPARNYSKESGDDGPKAYQFGPREVWNGLQEGGIWLCNGLNRDWASWQRENNESFRQLENALKVLSPPKEELKPGALLRISPEDSQDYPSVSMPYGLDVPLIHASAAVRRVLALAYLLVWSWQEHLMAVRLRREQAARRIVFLIDEAESHLHPAWQRRILPSLLSVVQEMIHGAKRPEIQLIASTHSPLVCLSMEAIFDEEKDCLIDIALNDRREAEVHQVPFKRLGTVENWLLSQSFELGSPRSEPAEAALDDAAKLYEVHRRDPSQVSRKEFRRIDQELKSVLPDTDDFWVLWRRVGEKRGWA